MNATGQLLSHLLALGTMGSQVVAIILLAAMILRPRWSEPVFRFLGRNGVLLAFLYAAVSAAMSLVYSEVIGFDPCKLCWLQRIFMYPQVVLLGIAAYKKDPDVADYSIGLSLVGGLIAVYHTYIQLGGSPLIPCSRVGYIPRCSQRYVFEFGYITIPVMALTAFVMLIILMAIVKRHQARRASHAA